MSITSTEPEALARRLETVERAALADLHNAAPDPLRRRLGMDLIDIDGTTVSIVAAADGVVVNRSIGLGVEHPATRQAIQAIIDAYAVAGVDDYYVHLQPDARPEGIRGWLADAGLARSRGWMQFLRDNAPPPPMERRSDLRVRQIGAEHAEWFGRIAAHGFGIVDELAAALAGLVTRAGWNMFMSFDGDEPAGAASLFVHDGVGWFDWAATRREFRRRGSQSLLLHHRVSAAAELRCELLATETGEAMSGDPQHSYRNILRAGFQEYRLRENFAPRAPRSE